MEVENSSSETFTSQEFSEESVELEGNVDEINPYTNNIIEIITSDQMLPIFIVTHDMDEFTEIGRYTPQKITKLKQQKSDADDRFSINLRYIVILNIQIMVYFTTSYLYLKYG